MAGWQARTLEHGDGNADFNMDHILVLICHNLLIIKQVLPATSQQQAIDEPALLVHTDTRHGPARQPVTLF